MGDSKWQLLDIIECIDIGYSSIVTPGVLSGNDTQKLQNAMATNKLRDHIGSKCSANQRTSLDHHMATLFTCSLVYSAYSTLGPVRPCRSLCQGKEY